MRIRASAAARAVAAARATGARALPLLAVLSVGACAAVEFGERPGLDAVGARMPAQLAGFQLGEAARRSGAGLVLDYATPDRRAVGSVQVHDAPGGSAPSDPGAAEIDRAVTAAVAEVAEAPQGRTGRRLAERERMTLREAGLRCAVLTGAFGRAPVMRHVCVGGADGRFVTVHVTMADTRPAPADAKAFAAAALRAVRGG